MITTTEKFKKGDLVWICAVDFHNSGRFRYNVSPKLVKIKEVTADWVKLDYHGCYMGYYVPETFMLNRSLSESDITVGSYRYSCDLNKHISLTEEESKKKYNILLKDFSNYFFEKYKKIESTILSKIL